MASSKRSTAPAKSSSTTSRGRRTTSTSSRTKSTSSRDAGAPASSPADPRASRSRRRRDAAGSAAGTAALRCTTVIIALGSNLGDRRYHLQRAVHAIKAVVRIVRVSTIHETAPVDAPAGSPPFLNMVIAGYTTASPDELLEKLLAIETTLGRVRRGVRNEPRVIDLDLILHGAHRQRTKTLTLPHPRYREREFVMAPMREVASLLLPEEERDALEQRAALRERPRVGHPFVRPR